MSAILHTTPTQLAAQIGDRLSPMLRQRIRITPVDARGGVIPRRGGYNADAKPEGLRVLDHRWGQSSEGRQAVPGNGALGARASAPDR